MKQRLKLKVKTIGKTKKIVGREVKKTHLMRKKVTIKAQEGIMRLPMTMTPQRVQIVIQKPSLTMNTVGPKMKKRTIMEMKIYQEMIKTPLALQK